MMTLIEKAGAYPDIDADDYHGNADLLPAPSLSSSGAKLLLNKSPLHFWWTSPMNPDRPGEDETAALNIGKAAHDLMLLSDRWPQHYHVLPEGYSRAASKKFAEAMAAEEDARERGMTILRHSEYRTVMAVADAIGLHDGAKTALSNGVPELTLAWQDAETGIWCRARPDFLPFSVINGAPVMVVSDLKFMDPRNCSPEGFSRALATFGYHNSAAFYEDGIKAIYGHAPTHWLFVVVEKEQPHSVSLYTLPAEDVARGRFENRAAIRLFADCLARGTERHNWPGYTTEPEEIGLPAWRRKQVDEHGSVRAATLIAA